jgi:RNA polymerase sigma factor (sigma-70 family)
VASSLSVFVIDDDPAVRKALKRLLSFEGFEVYVYSSAHAFLKKHDPSKPGCILLDIAMPELSGLELQRQLIASGNEPSIVFLTGKADIPMSVQAMKNGAIDFLTKPIQAEDLIPAIHAAIERDRLSRERREEVKSLEQRLATLTPREREVLAHVVQGQLNKQIAAELGTVEKTIKVHRARVFKKMAAQSLADLVRMSERLRIHG